MDSMDSATKSTSTGANMAAAQPQAKLSNSSAVTLSPAQLHALFDILTHFETYSEVEAFKWPGFIGRYGYPFVQNSADADGLTAKYSSQSSAPLLAIFLRSVVLPYPGICDLPPEFWEVRMQGLLECFAESELSESYDKGAVGTRKTLATAASVIHETVSRGCLGGLPRTGKRDLQRVYNEFSAEDLVTAWEDGMHELVYGELIDELFECSVASDNIEDHSSAVKAAAKYAIVHLATFIHHVIVLSPEGRYLLQLMDGVHKLMPYTMIKQTLRIGNAATMLGGMMRLLLAKVTVGAISNWFGFTQNADDGMNLLQRIISMVLSWDASVFRRLAEKIEKARDGPSKDHIKVIKRYVTEATRDQHEHIRAMSREKPESIIAAIFSDSQPDLLSSLSDAQHAQCLEYLSAILSVRDREEITNVLCRRNPDLFTQAIRDLIAAFEPIIRTLHENVDLREHVSAAEKVLNDFIETSKSKRVEGNELMGEHPPSVEDYVRLLERNRQFLYKWVHQVAANCPEVREVVRTWAKKTVRVFRQRHSDAEGPRGSTEENIASRNDPRPHETPARQKPSSGQAGDMTSVLQQLFQNLPDGNQTDLLRDLDAHAKYLAALNTLSLERMQRVLNNLKHEAGSTMTSNGNDRIGKANAASSGQAGILRRPWPFSTAASGSLSGRGTPASMSSATAPSKQSTSGPGVFLLRWQALLDRTLITPATANGPLRSGKDVKASTTPAKAAAIAASGDSRGSDWDSGSFARRAEEDVPTAPNVSAILRALGPGFRHLIMDIAREDALFSAG